VTPVLKRLTAGTRARRPASRRKPRTRRVTVASVQVASRDGKSTVTFPSLKLLRQLKAGQYEIVLLAVTSQQVSSASRTLKFTLR
jgi:hypothetical protein